MALVDYSRGLQPNIMKAMVGETVVGLIDDEEGRSWWLVVQSGHALVMTDAGSFLVRSPKDVLSLIMKRRCALDKQRAEADRQRAAENAKLDAEFENLLSIEKVALR